jgi:hypothetical protein
MGKSAEATGAEGAAVHVERIKNAARMGSAKLCTYATPTGVVRQAPAVRLSRKPSARHPASASRNARFMAIISFVETMGAEAAAAHAHSVQPGFKKSAQRQSILMQFANPCIPAKTGSARKVARVK